MNRRTFLSTLGGIAGAALWPDWAWAAALPRDIRITRIVGFDLESKRCKFCGKNSRLDVHGDRARDRMVRLYTNAGIEGLGNCRAGETQLAGLLGRNPFDFFHQDEPAFRCPWEAGTMPLWDLAGKALGRPAFNLLGGHGPRRVPVYDGSIYFSDLLPEYANAWRDRFKQEIDLGLSRGHRTFKIKIGRGSKWMPTEAGFDRDLEVISLIRRHAGPQIALGADANNGYDLARARRFVAATKEARLAFVEELFEEEVASDLELKAFIREQKLKTLIADGETQSKLEPFKPFMKARAVDIFEGDINQFGIEGILTEAAWAKAAKLQVSPHGWGSLVGFYLSLQVGRGIDNYYSGENDPLDNDILIADGYRIQDGKATVPNEPGFGLRLDEKRFAERIKPRFDLRA